MKQHPGDPVGAVGELFDGLVDERGGQVEGVLGRGLSPFGLVMGAPVSAGCGGTGGVVPSTRVRPAEMLEADFRPGARVRQHPCEHP